MASSRFHRPPNSYTLRENFMGGVVQRSPQPHDESRTGRGYSMYTSARRLEDNASQYRSTFVGQKRLHPLESLADAATERKVYNGQRSTEEPPEVRKMKVSASRRERCRVNQARYRQRQRQHAEGLDSGIQHLQEQIQELETKRQTLVRRTPTNESIWIVATEYFRLFRHGYDAPSVPEPVTSSSPFGSSSTVDWSTNNRKVKQAQAQRDFLLSHMAPDVSDGSLRGMDQILENWRLLSFNYGDVQVKLQRLEKDGVGGSVRATTLTSLTITENTLRNVYPHLVSNSNSNEGYSRLAFKLLNKRLIVRGSVRFDWDKANGRVVRLESKIDMVSAMLKLLGSLEDVASVFEKSLMTMDGIFITV